MNKKLFLLTLTLLFSTQAVFGADGYDESDAPIDRDPEEIALEFQRGWDGQEPISPTEERFTKIKKIDGLPFGLNLSSKALSVESEITKQREAVRTELEQLTNDIDIFSDEPFELQPTRRTERFTIYTPQNPDEQEAIKRYKQTQKDRLLEALQDLEAIERVPKYKQETLICLQQLAESHRKTMERIPEEDFRKGVHQLFFVIIHKFRDAFSSTKDKIGICRTSTISKYILHGIERSLLGVDRYNEILDDPVKKFDIPFYQLTYYDRTIK